MPKTSLSLRWFLLVFCLLTRVLSAEPFVSPREFAQWFEGARTGERQLSEAAWRRAAEQHFVFIAGFHSERRTYFQRQLQLLAEKGVPSDHIHLIRPRTSDTFDENIAQIAAQLKDITEKSEGPLVIVAHSRGAVETLAYAASQPEWVESRVKALFLLQGAFGGSPLADVLLGKEAHRPGLKMGVIPWLASFYETWRQRKIQQREGAAPALREFGREESGKQRRRVEEAAERAYETLHDKVYYVRSFADPRTLSFTNWVAGSYLSAYYGPSDGRVEHEGQLLRSIGHPLLTVSGAGHVDFTHTGKDSLAGDDLRDALLTAMVASVTEPTREVTDRDERTVTVPSRICSWLRRL